MLKRDLERKKNKHVQKRSTEKKIKHVQKWSTERKKINMLNKKLYFTFSTLNNSIEEFVIGGQNCYWWEANPNPRYAVKNKV